MAEPEKVYATADDLGPADQRWEEVELPVLGKTVCVLFLDTPTIAGLTFLPDIAGFGELVAEAEEKPTEVDISAYIVENVRYQAHVAHVAVIDPDRAQETVTCESCGLKHAPSLWTLDQAKRLQRPDLTAISEIAFKIQALARVLPLSEAETEPASQEPAVSGT